MGLVKITLLIFVALTFQYSMCLISLPPIYKHSSLSEAPTYTLSEIQSAKNASMNPLDYENMGLPTDAISSNDTDIKCILAELYEQREILFVKTVEEQSKYADAITRAKAADPEFGQHMMLDLVIFGKEYVFARAKECTIGDLAYLSMYSISPETRAWANNTLSDYVLWRYTRKGIDPNFKNFSNLEKIVNIITVVEFPEYYNDTPDTYTVMRCKARKLMRFINKFL